MRINDQITFDEIDQHYQQFVDKFKHNRTTDDCYTPDYVMDTVNEYVEARYGVSRERFVRPFWPQADYRQMEYPDGCVVVDNPPFSIISKIVNDYNDHGIRFFLFAPYLTCMGIQGATKIITDISIVYENKAEIATSFVTNMERGVIARSDPELREKIDAVQKKALSATKKEVPKYEYSDDVLTAPMLGYMSKNGVAFTVQEDDAFFIRALDAQRAVGKAIFGSGYLLSEKAAAEKAAAEKAAAEKAAAEKAAAEKAAAEKVNRICWKLSPRERMIQRELERKKGNHE